MKMIALLAILIAFGPLFAVVGRAVQNEKLRRTKPLVAISGANSHLRKPSYERITTAEEWTRAWVSHVGTTKDDAYRSLFEVDFERCLVVVIFRGERVNVRGIEIDSLLETGDSIVIRFNELTYQTGQLASEKPTPRPPDRPYAFVVLPKSNKTLVLEEGIRQYKRDPPMWKERARLEASHSAERQNVKRQ